MEIPANALSVILQLEWITTPVCRLSIVFRYFKIPLTFRGGWGREKLLHCKSLTYGREKALELEKHLFLIPSNFVQI